MLRHDLSLDGRIRRRLAGVRAQAISPAMEFEDEDDVEEADLAEAESEGDAEEVRTEAREDGAREDETRDEGDGRRRTCVLRGGPCRRDGACDVHDAFARAQEAVFGTLADVSLADVTR